MRSWSGIKKQDALVFDAELFEQLQILVAQGESQYLEFKRKVSEGGEKIVRELIAFANSSGGTLLIGVGDDKTIPGVKYPEDESLAVQQALEKVQPALNIEETWIAIGNNRTVLQYVVHVSDNRPHFIADDQGAREYFIRSADKSIRASREMREIIKRRLKKRDIRFHYGEHEHFLMQYLANNKTITLSEFVGLSGLKKFYASNKLILLVSANVLRIIPSERGDQFTLAFTKS
ncbi:ATP-binding protein [Chryseolinea sp. T2]|uniref:AlbA family DNA-binding domain-containing protein n=1 Tax=Chryseolinea sp. T2 TaxID=3129255 RepID=UPI003077E5F5